MHAAIHRSHYSEEEKRSTWFTHDEMRKMKAERSDSLRIMERVNSEVDDGIHYFRGLESKTVDGYKRRRFVIVDACIAVMDEQANQEDCGLHDPDLISRIYMDYTRQCADAARCRGLRDEIAAIAATSSTASPTFFERVIGTLHSAS